MLNWLARGQLSWGRDSNHAVSTLRRSSDFVSQEADWGAIEVPTEARACSPRRELCMAISLVINSAYLSPLASASLTVHVTLGRVDDSTTLHLSLSLTGVMVRSAVIRGAV